LPPRLWATVALAAAGIVLVAAGLRLLLTGGFLRPPDQVAESRSHTRTDAEELVRRFILNNLDDEDAARTEFLAWGPHMEKAEWLALWREADLYDIAKVNKEVEKEMAEFEAVDSIVRVCYLRPGRKIIGLRITSGGDLQKVDEDSIILWRGRPCPGRRAGGARSWQGLRAGEARRFGRPVRANWGSWGKVGGPAGRARRGGAHNDRAVR
jgi:hypothetical protein